MREGRESPHGRRGRSEGAIQSESIDTPLESNLKGWLVALAALGIVVFGRPGIAGDAPASGVGVVTVVGPDQRPVQGASVRLRSSNAPPDYASRGRRTGTDGTVTFEGLDGDVEHAVTVTPPHADEGLAEQDLHGWLPRAGLRVTLARGWTVRGVTIDDTGKPRRAIVRIRDREPFSGMSIPTGELGEFEFRHRPAGAVEVLATPYRGEVWIHDEVPDDTAWTEVASDAGPLRLPITNIPAPTVVEVSITGPGGAIPELVRLETTSGRTWRTRDVRRGRTTLTVTFGDEIHLRAIGAVAADGSKLDWAPTRARPTLGEARLRIEMPVGRSVVGRVVDENGMGVSGVVVFAKDSEPIFSKLLSDAVSSGDGRFRLPSLGDEEVAIATHASAGFAPAKRLLAAPGSNDIVIVVRRAIASRIRIVDSAGVAVADAQVSVMEKTESPGKLVGSGPANRTALDGSTELPPMDPTVHRQLVIRPPAGRDDLAPLEIDAWVPQSGDITLPRGYVATLRVLDEEDRPVEADVARWTPPRDGAFDEGSFSTVEPINSAGVVRVRELPIGRNFFRARPNSSTGVFPSGSAWTLVDDRQPDVVLRIPKRGKPMRIRTDRGAVDGLVGTIYADMGGPAFDFSFLFHGSLGRPNLSERGTPPVSIVIEPSTTRLLEFSKTGTAALPAVARGTFSILVMLPSGTKPLVGRIDLASFDGADVVIPLVAPADLRIVVAADGPIEDLSGRLEVAGQFVASVKRVEDSVLLGEGLPPGRDQLRVTAEVGGRPMGAVAAVETGAVAHVTLVEDRSPNR